VKESEKPRFFVQMECLFNGEKAANLKDIDYGTSNLVSTLIASGIDVTGQFGDLLAHTIEDHILPADPDLFVSESGAVRWLDGERWRPTPSLVGKAYEFAQTFWVVYEYIKRAMSSRPDLWKSASDRFLEQFFTRIEKSRKLLRSEKAALWTQIFRGKAARDFRMFPITNVLPQDQIEPLFQDAYRFFKNRSLSRDVLSDGSRPRHSP
jgi:hypothetical protein